MGINIGRLNHLLEHVRAERIGNENEVCEQEQDVSQAEERQQVVEHVSHRSTKTNHYAYRTKEEEY